MSTGKRIMAIQVVYQIEMVMLWWLKYLYVQETLFIFYRVDNRVTWSKFQRCMKWIISNDTCAQDAFVANTQPAVASSAAFEKPKVSHFHLFYSTHSFHTPVMSVSVFLTCHYSQQTLSFKAAVVSNGDLVHKEVWNLFFLLQKSRQHFDRKPRQHFDRKWRQHFQSNYSRWSRHQSQAHFSLRPTQKRLQTECHLLPSVKSQRWYFLFFFLVLIIFSSQKPDSLVLGVQKPGVGGALGQSGGQLGGLGGSQLGDCARIQNTMGHTNRDVFFLFA